MAGFGEEALSIGGLAAVGVEIYGNVFYATHPSVSDLAPGSPYINTLVTNPGLEQTSVRRAIAADVLDYAAAPWRLTMPQGEADAEAEYVNALGYFVLLGGLGIELLDDPEEDVNYWEHMNGAWALEDLGELVTGLPWFVNYGLIGAIPNDGLLPTATEFLPNAPLPFQLPGLAHSETIRAGTGATTIVSALNEMTGR